MTLHDLAGVNRKEFKKSAFILFLKVIIFRLKILTFFLVDRNLFYPRNYH